MLLGQIQGLINCTKNTKLKKREMISLLNKLNMKDLNKNAHFNLISTGEVTKPDRKRQQHYL